MGYVSFRGVPTSSLTNVITAKMPNHRKAAVRHTEYTIMGRDGSVHIDDGYDPIDIIVYVMLNGASASSRQEVNAWADGTGKLYSSDDTTRCYVGTPLKGIEWTRDEVGGLFYDTAKIVFHCQPHMHETTDRLITLTSSDTVVNLGDVVSRPLIKVYGSGDADFTINGNTIAIDNMTSSHPVTIDSETGYVYTDAGATTMTGEIPFFGLGNNTVDIGDNITKLEINPRWGWV